MTIVYMKTEGTQKHLEMYEERELMFTAWERYEDQLNHVPSMPEVELVQRVLSLSPSL